MSEESAASSGGNDAPITVVESGASGELTMNHAAKALADIREKRNQSSAESAPAATAEPELSDEGNAAAVEEQPTGETQEADPAETPPLELPRSWTKEQAEHWNALPRATQEYLAAQDSKASAEVRRVQNEAAEQRKAYEAERTKAEQARQLFESKLSTTVKAMESTLQAEFGDIQTMQDVRNLQANDPFRFQAWQVRQMELTAAKSETFAAEQRQAQEKQSKRANYEAEQNKLLVELVPEMADPKKASELRERAIAMLTDDLGLKNDLLGRWMNDDTGHEILSNAGIQKLIADGLKYRDILKAPKAVAAKPVPKVQQPGVSKPAGSVVSERLQTLDSKLTNSGSLKDAMALRLAQLNASKRRAS